MKNRIKECREQDGLTLKEVAVIANIFLGNLKEAENASDPFQVLSGYDIEKVAIAVHVNPAYLVGWSDHPDWSMHQSTTTDYQLDTVQKVTDWQFSTEERQHKLYAGGVVFHFKDGTKLYDKASLDDVGDYVSDDLLYANNILVPISNVSYVESIPNITEDDK